MKGALVVEKMPLMITPNDLQYTYGEKFDDQINFTYTVGGEQYDFTRISLYSYCKKYRPSFIPFGM